MNAKYEIICVIHIFWLTMKFDTLGDYKHYKSFDTYLTSNRS